MRSQYTKVYIIESPSPEDVLDGRREGNALASMLQLGGISVELYDVINMETLRTAMTRIADDFLGNGQYRSLGLHFSMHGDEDGLELCNGDLVDWDDLHKLLDELNITIGYRTLDNPKYAGKHVSMVYLQFSSCSGLHAEKLVDMGDYCCYFSLVGPPDAVDWSDSLLAFATFYHNLIYWDGKPADALFRMNAAIGKTDAFQLKLGKAKPIKS